LLCETGEHFWRWPRAGVTKRLLPLRGQPGPLRGHQPPRHQDLDACLRDLTGQEAEPTRVRLAVEGRAALDALNELIDNAAERIDVLMFYWRATRSARRLRRGWRRRRGRGCACAC